MIEQYEYTYYLTFAMICAALGVTYIKLKSTEGLVITTKEFKIFQTSFLTGYSAMILGELIASASFYHTLISLGLSLEKITKLYIVTIVSTTLFGVLLDIVDIGTRKDKCCASALLFAIAMFSFFFGGHFEMLLMGRIVYGAASALLHSSYDSYLVHEHTTLGK
jgi:MFS family permease